MADAEETRLARAVAGIIGTAGLGVYRTDGTAYAAGEHAILVDKPLPTSINGVTLITPFERSRAGRTEVTFRVQVATRLVSPTGGKAAIRERADLIAALFDRREYTPPILGISYAAEYSRLFFDADTQNRVMVTQNFMFTGHTP